MAAPTDPASGAPAATAPVAGEQAATASGSGEQATTASFSRTISRMQGTPNWNEVESCAALRAAEGANQSKQSSTKEYRYAKVITSMLCHRQASSFHFSY